MARFVFVGQPEDSFRDNVIGKGTPQMRVERVLSAKKGDGPDVVTRYGHTFEKDGEPVEIPDTPENERHIQVLRICSHFSEVKEPKAAAPSETASDTPRRGPGRPPANPQKG